MTTATQPTARVLREHLCTLFTALGPDAPTLCDGWTTRDLAAHLIVRERRPDAMPGIMIEKLAGHTKAVQDSEAGRGFDELVQRVRTGPPVYSPMRIPLVDEKANTAEYAIHVEDVRLAQPENVQATLPALPDGVQDAIWSALPLMAKMALRTSPVRVTAVRDDGAEQQLAPGKGDGDVRLVGRPTDILMTLTGRNDAVPTRIEGSDDSVAAFKTLELGL